MLVAKIKVDGSYAGVVARSPITAGMSGVTILVEYAPGIWDGLTKTVVFEGAVAKDNITNDTIVKIPPEVLTEPNKPLRVGFVGMDGDENLVIPTVWADLGRVQSGADPSGDTSTDPSLPVWGQLATKVDSLAKDVEELQQGGGTTPGPGGSVDLTGYATEEYVREYAQPKGDYLTTDSIDEIAQRAADLVEIPDSGGNVDLTGYATEQWVQDQKYLTEVPEGYAKTKDIPTKPEDIGAQPKGEYALKSQIPTVPTKVSAFENDSGYLTEHQDISGKLDADKLPEEVNPLIDTKLHSVTIYGATGDGVTNDTKAFRDALANNRIVTVPGGTYVLSDTLVIRENCCLELSQDTVLQFTQTEGNCVEMRGSAVLRGNQAVISAAFGLTDKVISMDTLQDGTNHASIPPYTKADPQWKRQRFVYDVNIIKQNPYGFNRPLADGVCRGKAIYMSATNLPTGTDNPDNTDIPFMWGITMSGVRIAGGFSYGIHAVNYDSPAGSSGHYADDAWNHDMRIEAIVEGCEIGVCLENCNGAHLNVTVQPNVSNPGSTKYAKQGVCLKDSRFVDMMRSRVWDWHVARNDSDEYQHLALYGNCRGLLLDDFLVYENQSVDIRDQIYTDTPANFDTMTILQEPGNKWFKNVDGVPKFFDGTSDKTLMLKTDKFSAEQAEFIKPADGYYTYEPNFKNLVDGYTDGTYLAGSSTSTIADTYTTTDFIPVDGGSSHVYRIGGEGITWDDSYGYCRIAWYNADKSLKGSVMDWRKIGSSIYYPQWVEDETVAAAFSTDANVAPPNGAEYFRVTAKGNGANLIVTLDEPQEYNAIWHGEPKRLDESIHAVTDWNAAEGEVGYIKNKPASLGGSAPADWNAAEGEPGHVLNRPFYDEFPETVFPETTLVVDEEEGIMLAEADVNIQAGDTYTVYWNGVPYTCEARKMDDGTGTMVPALGNINALIGTGDTGEPFVAICAPGMIVVVDLTGATEASLKIDKPIAVKLPFRYYEPVFYADVYESEDDSGTKVYTTKVTPNALVKAVKDGQTVIARVHTTISHDNILKYVFIPLISIWPYLPSIAEFRGFVSVNQIGWLALRANSDNNFDEPCECQYQATNG